MTTIVADAREGVMIGDTQVTFGDVVFRSDKVARTRHGLVGAAGHSPTCTKFLQAMNKVKLPTAELPGIDDVSFAALRLTADGKLWLYGGSFLAPDLVSDGHFAVGTGSPFALAALKLGHTAVEAATVACELDINSALPLQIEYI